jgi:PUA domain protein
VIVDMGAVRFVTGGADVMRPGIVEIDEAISKGEYVVVKDERNRMPLAICIANHPGAEMRSMEKGKVLVNIHYVGDELWNIKNH